MARVTMARAAVSMRPSAHSPLDNVSTKYNPIRLLKGAPPGQVIIFLNLSKVVLQKNIHFDLCILYAIALLPIFTLKTVLPPYHIPKD